MATSAPDTLPPPALSRWLMMKSQLYRFGNAVVDAGWQRARLGGLVWIRNVSGPAFGKVEESTILLNRGPGKSSAFSGYHVRGAATCAARDGLTVGLPPA